MKRESTEKFDLCEDFKKACGSQFRQYIAKTALASRVALNEQKIQIHQESNSMDKKCAGCEIPIESCKVVQYCKYGCKQVVECDWNFCQGWEDVHACANCGKTDWCKRADLDLIIFCKKCKGAVCDEDSCISSCDECNNGYCKKCARETSNGREFIILLCSYHKDAAKKCEKCISEGRLDFKICKDFRCNRMKCAHTSTHIDYCQEHAADHK
jgi:hypothetical protein